MARSRSIVLTVFALILIAMLMVTTWASLDRSIFQVGQELLGDRWFHATLADAYCGFVTFYAWLAWREESWLARILWFVAVMLLGNIAMSIYVLIATLKLKDNFSIARLLLGRHANLGLSSES